MYKSNKLVNGDIYEFAINSKQKYYNSIISKPQDEKFNNKKKKKNKTKRKEGQIVFLILCMYV